MNLFIRDPESTGSSASFPQTTVLIVGYASISIVSVVMVARILLQYLRPRKVAAEDCCMFFAYVLFLAQCVLYIVLSPIRVKMQEVKNGEISPYLELPFHAYLIGRLIFPALMFFWAILWTVKFGLLLLYRKLIAGLPGVYDRIWWFIVIFCGIVSSFYIFQPGKNTILTHYLVSRRKLRRFSHFLYIAE